MGIKKEPYVSPQFTVSEVELESSICAGSVDFTKDEKITISSQEFADGDWSNAGDWSGESNWTPSSTAIE